MTGLLPNIGCLRWFEDRTAVGKQKQNEVKTLDKAEYRSKLDQLTSLADKEDYKGALEIVESVDWRRVKSIRTLSMVADVYEANKMYPERMIFFCWHMIVLLSEKGSCTAWWKCL